MTPFGATSHTLPVSLKGSVQVYDGLSSSVTPLDSINK